MPSRLILTQRNLRRKIRTVSVQKKLANGKIFMLTPLFVPLKLSWTVLFLRRRFLKFYLSQSTLYIKILHYEINNLKLT